VEAKSNPVPNSGNTIIKPTHYRAGILVCRNASGRQECLPHSGQLYPARRIARANAFVARDTRTAAHAHLNKCAAIRAIVGFDFIELPRLHLCSTCRASLRVGNCFQSLWRYRFATNLTHNGSLPIAVVIIEFLRRPRKQCLFFANRAGHLVGCFDEQRFHEIVMRLPFATQFTNDSQPRNGVIAAANGSPTAFSACEFV
jgi:hypothetical protein